MEYILIPITPKLYTFVPFVAKNDTAKGANIKDIIYKTRREI